MCCSRQSRERFLDPACRFSIPESGVYQKLETVPRPGGSPPWEGIPQRGEAGPSMSRAAINMKITRVTSNVWLDFYVPARLHEAWHVLSHVTSVAVVCLCCSRATLFHSLFISHLNFLAPLAAFDQFFPSLTSLYVTIFLFFILVCLCVCVCVCVCV
jgi:hypothetical protein